MKKKITRRAPAKATHRTTRRSTSGNQDVVFRRIIIISACLVLFFVTIVMVNKQNVTQSVAGISVMNGLFMQATVGVPHDFPEAISYNIYYKTADEEDFTNAVRNVSPSVRSYTISHLKKGSSYQYRFAAVDAQGEEFVWSEVQELTSLQPM